MGTLKGGRTQEVERRARTFQTRAGFEQESRGRHMLGRVSGWHGGLKEGNSGRRGAGWGAILEVLHLQRCPRGTHTPQHGTCYSLDFQCCDMFGSVGCGTIEDL